MSHNFYAIVIIEPEVTIEELNNEWLCHICQLHMTRIGNKKCTHGRLHHILYKERGTHMNVLA